MSNNKSLSELFNTLPQVGKVEWIGIRPARRQPIEVLGQVQADTHHGLIGDRYAGSSGKRQVTLVQWEHLAAIRSMLSIDILDPALLRRNIMISGVNLLALKEKQFKLGNAVLEYTGLCHPCSFMETTFGPGGYNAMRGHGGLTARVIQSGLIRVNDQLLFTDTL